MNRRYALIILIPALLILAVLLGVIVFIADALVGIGI